MRVDRSARHSLADTRLDLFRQLVRLSDGPGVRHEQVERHKAAGTGLARAQGVKGDAVAAGIFVEQLGDRALVVGRDGRIQQPRHRAPHQAHAGPDDVRRHRERDERVEHQPPGGEYQRHARDHADRGPHVGHEMLAVRLQRNAVVAASRAPQY